MSLFWAWPAVAFTFLALGGLGRFVAPPQQHMTFGSLWWGWGLGAVLMTLYAVATPWSLTPFLVVCAGLGLLGYAWHRPSRNECLAIVKLITLSLPLLWVWSHNQVFMWDDYAHRLPSFLFVDTFDSLPRHSLPPNLSVWPSYPYALTVLGLAVNRLLGSYTELAISIVNGALTIAFAGLLAQNLAQTMKPESNAKSLSWNWLATGLILVTVINPVFNRQFAASAYQEIALGISMAVVFILLRPVLIKNAVLTYRQALALGLVLALVTGLKQVGLVLAIMMLAPVLLLLGYRLRQNPRQLLTLMGLLLTPLLAIWLAWRHYVAVNIGGGEFSYFPWHEWHWNLWPIMAHSLGTIIVQKPLVFLPLIAVSTLAALSLRLPRLTPQRLALLLAATVGWGYLIFLLITYIGSFSAYEAGNLASFSRYLQHVNWMLWTATVLTLAPYVNPWLIQRRYLAKAMFILLAIPLLVPSHYNRKTSAEAKQMKALATKLPQLLPADQNLIIQLNEPEGVGFRYYVLRYHTGYRYNIQQGYTRMMDGDTSTPPDAIITLGHADAPIQFSRCRQNKCEPAQNITLP